MLPVSELTIIPTHDTCQILFELGAGVIILILVAVSTRISLFAREWSTFASYHSRAGIRISFCDAFFGTVVIVGLPLVLLP